MPTQFAEFWNDLTREFDSSFVKLLPKGKGIRYVTARTVQNRLDAVCGPENWTATYRPNGNDSLFCELTITLPDGRRVTKIDVGGGAGMADAGDDDKSAVSDAFKRAAVCFGIGRYLYGDGQVSHDLPAAAEAEPEAEPAAGSSPAPPPVEQVIRSGTDLGFWAADAGKAAGYDLVEFLRQWKEAREIEASVNDWDTATVARALKACRARLKRVAATAAAG